ncbi:MAG: hypothetical protein IH583_00200, partial [Candidatus Aminicenantes bacterium]|nr:hypothetical protein [Candidatus Aminicenantes bacterium]
MRKRLPLKSRQPWPEFILVTIALTATALLSALLLDYIAARKGEPSYIFAAGAKAPAPVPAVKPAAKSFEEVLAAGLA